MPTVEMSTDDDIKEVEDAADLVKCVEFNPLQEKGESDCGKYQYEK